jgi:hypothetical protein
MSATIQVPESTDDGELLRRIAAKDLSALDGNGNAYYRSRSMTSFFFLPGPKSRCVGSNIVS